MLEPDSTADRFLDSIPLSPALIVIIDMTAYAAGDSIFDLDLEFVLPATDPWLRKSWGTCACRQRGDDGRWWYEDPSALDDQPWHAHHQWCAHSPPESLESDEFRDHIASAMSALAEMRPTPVTTYLTDSRHVLQRRAGTDTLTFRRAALLGATAGGATASVTTCVGARADEPAPQLGWRGALALVIGERPRPPQWLYVGLEQDPWLSALAGDILAWVGVPASAGTKVWPLDAWLERLIGEASGRRTTGPVGRNDPQECATELNGEHARWRAEYVERPPGRKQAPVFTIRPAAATRLARLPSDDELAQARHRTGNAPHATAAGDSSHRRPRGSHRLHPATTRAPQPAGRHPGRLPEQALVPR